MPEAKLPKFTKNISISINYVYISLAVIAVLALLIFLVLYPRMGWDYKMLDVMSFLTGSVAIVSLIYHTINISNNLEMHRQNLKVSLLQYTFDVVATFHDPKMNASIRTLRLIKDDEKNYLQKKNMSEFSVFLKANPDMYANMVQVFNYFEHVSLLVVKDQVDESIIKSSFKTLFLSTYKEYRFYIDERQKIHRSAWIEYENLCKKWELE